MKQLLALYKRHKSLFKTIAAFAGLEILMILIPLTIYGTGLYLVIAAFFNHPNDPLVHPNVEKVIIGTFIIKRVMSLPKKAGRRIKARLST